MIEVLETRPQRDARQRLADFVLQARTDCAAFGTELDWDRPDWDVTAYCPQPANKSHGRSVIYFTTHEGGSSKSMKGRTPLPEPFASLIKAIVRTRQDGNPQTVHPLSRIVNAARDLSLELADRGHDPCLLLPQDFAAAANRVRQRATGVSVYRLGQALEIIAATIDAKGIGFCRLDWKNPIPRAANNGSRQSEVADSARESSIPDEEVFDALAAIWNAVEDDSDIVLMGAVTLLHCAPWRIVETLGINENCEIEEQKEGANGPVFDLDGIGIFRFGIRYWKEKSGEPDVKWIPTVMTDVARLAIERVRSVTAGARELARWLHDHPGRAWLPDPDLDPDKLYTVRDVQAMFGMAAPPAALLWLNQHNVPLGDQPRPSGGKTRKVVRRVDLEAALLADMPVIPASDRETPLHERLFLSFRNAHHATRATNPCLLEIVSDQQIRDFLGGRSGIVASGFDRILQRRDLVARTHQFRHWLNTLAQAGGLEQGLIARWSGRDDVAQNSEYDHLTPTFLAEQARELLNDGKVIGPLADIHTSLPPVERAAFAETVIATAHVTEIGFCLQDWNSSPCPEFGACATCESAAIKKGDRFARVRAAQMRDDNAWIAERLVAEVDDGTIGASQHHRATVDVVNALDRIIAIHDDPTIEDGTLVQPNATSPAHYGGPDIRITA